MMMVKKKIVDSISSDDPKSRRWKSLISSARLAYASGESRQAESLLVRARELATELQEKEFAVSAAEIGLGAVELAKSNHKQAASKLQRTIDVLRHTNEPKMQELLAVALRFHADALVSAESFRAAEKELLESAEILSRLGVESCVQLSYTLCDLSALYLLQGRLSEASKNINSAIDILIAALGVEDPMYVKADLICTIAMPMDYQNFCETVSCGIQKLEYIYGERHPNVARALQRYAKVLSDKGDISRLEATKEKFNFLSKGRRY